MPSGTTLNPKNIDHIYQYVGVPEVAITNSGQYQYYVASVNQANVVSDATLFNESGEIETVKQETLQVLNNFVNTLGANEYELVALKAMIIPYKTIIENATSLEAIQTASTQCRDQIEDFYTDLCNLKQIKLTAFNELSTSKMNEKQKQDFEKLKTGFIDQINKAVDLDQVIEIAKTAETEYRAILKREYPKDSNNCTCAGKDLYFMELLTAVTLLGLVIRRKK